MSLLLRSISSGAAAFARVIPFLTKLLDFGRAAVLAGSASSNIAERLSISSGDRKEGLQEQTSWSLGGHAGEYETIFNRQQGLELHKQQKRSWTDLSAYDKD